MPTRKEIQSNIKAIENNPHRKNKQLALEKMVYKISTRGILSDCESQQENIYKKCNNKVLRI